MMKKIISGGQTGADQAALDAAITVGVAHGGWLPAGRKTENGTLPHRYALEEMATTSYPERTKKNIMEADATLIISRGQLSGGSALTVRIAQERGKPWLHIDLQTIDHHTAVQRVRRWLQDVKADVLNIAGPRASSDGEIYQNTYDLVLEILQEEAAFSVTE